MCCNKTPLSWWLWMGCSTVFALAAIATALCWNLIISTLMTSVLVLSPSSPTYERWVAPDQPLMFEVFMFNWTNADRFPKEKPKFDQLGPYRFREIRKHVNVTIHQHNSSVAYRTQRTWFYDHSSNGSLEDIFTTINMPAATAAVFTQHMSAWEYYGASLFTPSISKLTVSKTVREMLFEGYAEPLLIAARLTKLPEGTPVFDRFGYFYKRNNSIDTDGYMEITSGAGDGPLGQILKWNHQDSLPYFQGKCSKLAGSAGEFIARNLTENSTLTMFVPDLCRTVDLDHVDSGVMDGLDYHKFEMLERVFDKSNVTTENNCYCNGDCRWGGVMNVSACRYNTPVFLSLPHFLHADPVLRQDVEGLKPNHTKHSFYFTVEPTLGVPIDVAARFQFNVFVEPFLKRLSMPKTVSLFPVFWVQQHVKVTDDILTELRVVIAVSRWGGLVFVVIGLIFAAVVVVCCSRKPKYIRISAG